LVGKKEKYSSDDDIYDYKYDDELQNFYDSITDQYESDQNSSISDKVNSSISDKIGSSISDKINTFHNLFHKIQILDDEENQYKWSPAQTNVITSKDISMSHCSIGTQTTNNPENNFPKNHKIMKDNSSSTSDEINTFHNFFHNPEILDDLDQNPWSVAQTNVITTKAPDNQRGHEHNGRNKDAHCKNCKNYEADEIDEIDDNDDNDDTQPKQELVGTQDDDSSNDKDIHSFHYSSGSIQDDDDAILRVFHELEMMDDDSSDDDENYDYEDDDNIHSDQYSSGSMLDDNDAIHRFFHELEMMDDDFNQSPPYNLPQTPDPTNKDLYQTHCPHCDEHPEATNDPENKFPNPKNHKMMKDTNLLNMNNEPLTIKLMEDIHLEEPLPVQGNKFPNPKNHKMMKDTNCLIGNNEPLTNEMMEDIHCFEPPLDQGTDVVDPKR
jgi:hypothetical protein